MLTLITLLKKCNSYLLLLSRIKVFVSRRNRILFYNSNILTHLDFCCIIWGNCSSTLDDKQRTTPVDCDFFTLSSELFKELNWQTFPDLMYRIINICPDYLKNYVSNTSDVSCRDTRSTNCNQLYTPKPNCELSCHSCTLEVSYGILSPLHVKHATWVNTFKSLYLKWKRLNGHCIISITTANLILYFVLI